MVAAIDQAVLDQDIYALPKAAENAGMTGGELKRGISQKWEYSFTDDGGGTVKVECYWYDQSRPFQIKPDMHVMKADLHDAEGRLSHVGKYEE